MHRHIYLYCRLSLRQAGCEGGLCWECVENVPLSITGESWKKHILSSHYPHTRICTYLSTCLCIQHACVTHFSPCLIIKRTNCKQWILLSAVIIPLEVDIISYSSSLARVSRRRTRGRPHVSTRSTRLYRALYDRPRDPALYNIVINISDPCECAWVRWANACEYNDAYTSRSR